MDQPCAPHLIEIGWDDESDHDGTLTIRLEDISREASQTRLVLVHALAEAPGAINQAAGFGAGWEGFLAGLQAELDGGGTDAVQAADLDRYEELLPGYVAQAQRLAASS